MDTISALILFAAVFVGWSIGANSASNVVSTLVGPSILSYKKALLLVMALMVAGALLQSGPVIKTLESGIVPKGDLENDRLIAASALLSTVIFVGIATSQALPVSSSHAIVGALAGLSLSIGIMKKANQDTLFKILLSWLLTPILSLIFAVVIYKWVLIPMSKKVSLVIYSQTFKILAVISTAFVAYGLGANNVGNSVGLVIGSGTAPDSLLILVIVILAMCFGIVSFGKKVVTTVSRNITLIDPVTAFTAQFSSGIVIYFFTIVGIPISTTQAILGGLVGVGITKGTGMFNRNLVIEILVGWIITPASAALLSILIYDILRILAPLLG